MPFNIADIVNTASRAALKSPTTRTVMGNPIYTGVFVAFILMLICAFVYRDTDAGWSSAARVAVWAFFVLMGTFALHRMVIREEMRADHHDDQSAQVFGSHDIRTLMRQDIVPVSVGRAIEPAGDYGGRTDGRDSEGPYPTGDAPQYPARIKIE